MGTKHPVSSPENIFAATMSGFSPITQDSSTPKIALEARLRNCTGVVTFGVRPNFGDYTIEEQTLIRRAAKIYYPTSFYADLLKTLGKQTFPSYQTYRFAQDKIKQSALFSLAGIVHPRTRVFYGRRQKKEILNYFDLPLIAKVPRGSALGRGVFLIRSPRELSAYCQSSGPAYIQEYLAFDRDIRVVVIGKRCVHAYWRIAIDGEHRTNVSMGGRIDLSSVPKEAIHLAEQIASTCGWDDVGLDICEHRGTFYVLEANMKYGREGFRAAGIDYHGLMERLINNGEI